MTKTITYQSCTIFYRVTGNGKPVVLLHGFGEDGNIWNAQVAYLKDRFCLIVPDLPGSGGSEMIKDMSIVGMAEVIKAILAEEKTVECCMLGHSMGGYITLALAEKYPALLKRFGLVHSSAFADSEEKKIARSKSIAFIKNIGAYQFLKTSIPGLFKGSDGSKPSDPYIYDLIEKGNNFSPEALIQYYEAMRNRPDRTEVLKNFIGPILFVMGEYDTAAPFQDSLKQCYLPHMAHVHILRNSAHMGMLEETVKTNEVLGQFLA